METNWPTREKDLDEFQEILVKYLDLNDGKSLPFVEVIVAMDKPVELKMPDWLAEAAEHFDFEYGPERGHEVMCKVLSDFIIDGDPIH